MWKARMNTNKQSNKCYVAKDEELKKPAANNITEDSRSLAHRQRRKIGIVANTIY